MDGKNKEYFEMNQDNRKDGNSNSQQAGKNSLFNQKIASNQAFQDFYVKKTNINSQNENKDKEVNLELLVSSLAYHAPTNVSDTKNEALVKGDLLLTGYNEIIIPNEPDTFHKMHDKISPEIKQTNFLTTSQVSPKTTKTYHHFIREPKKPVKQFDQIPEYHQHEKKESRDEKMFSDIQRRFDYLVRQSKGSSSGIKEEDKIIINHIEILRLFNEIENINKKYEKTLKKNHNLRNQLSSKDVIPKIPNPIFAEREIRKLQFEIKVANAKIQRLSNEQQGIKTNQINQVFGNSTQELIEIQSQNQSLKNDIKSLENKIKSTEKKISLISKNASSKQQLNIK